MKHGGLARQTTPTFEVVISHLNARSMLSKLDDIIAYTRETNCSILAITETWLSQQITQETVNIPGFTAYRSDRPDRGGGAAVYVTNQLSCIQSKTETILSTNGMELVSIKVYIYNTPYRVTTIYRPNYVPIDECITAIMENSDSSCDNIIIGDFNIPFDLDHWSSHPLHSATSVIDLIPIITFPTRVTKSSRTILVQIYLPK